MGQHCSCVQAKKRKEIKGQIDKLKKADSPNLKNSTTATLSPPHFEIPSNKKVLENLKDNADIIFPNNNSIAISISDVANFESQQKKAALEENEIFHSSKEKKIHNLETIFMMDKKMRPFSREFNYQEELNKPKIAVVEIYQKNDKGQWIENLKLKGLCAFGDEINKFANTKKKIQIDWKIKDSIEEIAA